MPGQIGPVLVMVLQASNREKPRFRQYGIDGGSSMALAKNEAIAPSPAWIFMIHPQHATAIENAQKVSDAQGRADVRTLAAVRHAQCMEANAPSQFTSVHGRSMPQVKVEHLVAHI